MPHPAPSCIIVGAGLMGRWHAHFAGRVGVAVEAIVDPNRVAAERLAGNTARTYPALETALDDSRAEVVHICTPPGTHDELGAIALIRERYVVIEKPVARSATSARNLVQMASERRRFIVPVHQFPFQRGFRKIRQQLHALAPLRRVEFRTATAGAQGAPDPREVLLEILPHAVSLFRALGFAPTAAGAMPRRFSERELEVEWQLDAATLVARIDCASRPTFNEVEVWGEAGSAIADLHHGFATIDRTRTATRRDKLTRPFRSHFGGLWNAASNLALRSATGSPAYPGLGELLGDTYRRVAAGQSTGPIDPNEFVVAAELDERLREYLVSGAER